MEKEEVIQVGKSAEELAREMEEQFVAEQEAPEELIQREDLVQMTHEQLAQLKADIVSEFDQRIRDAEDRFKALEETYKKQEALAFVDRRGEPTGVEGVEIMQRGPLGPIDHQGRIVKEYADKLKGKKARFVTTSDPELRALRRSQGYEPVRDEDGNEVRYMDGVLMAMPERKYEETIKAPKIARKKRHAAGIENKFKETAEALGVESHGKISYD